MIMTPGGKEGLRGFVPPSLSGYTTPAMSPSPVKQQSQGPALIFSPPAQSWVGQLSPTHAAVLSQPLLSEEELAEKAYWVSAQLLSLGISPTKFLDIFSDPAKLDIYARYYRSAVAGVPPFQMMEGPACTWSKPLPPRCYKQQPVFSSKVFVGGVPWDITEDALVEGFGIFGSCHVEWPGKEARYARSPPKLAPRHKGTGYVYMIFNQEQSVRNLLQACSREFGGGGDHYFKLTARRQRTKEIRQVQVIPWVISDSNYVRAPSNHLDPKKTVFVGALHGMVTAEILSLIMNDLFGNVVYAGIDTDKFKYPIGSGRVTFSSAESFYRAINAAYVEIKTPKFAKRVQIDPFLEDAVCSICQGIQGPYFCREMVCFKYFCRACWQVIQSLCLLSFSFSLSILALHCPVLGI